MKIDYFEYVKMGYDSLFAHRLRTALTLLGIVVGTACIIGVMTTIELLSRKVQKEMNQLGTDTFQVQKWPAIAGKKDWRDIVKRKPLTMDDVELIKRNISGAQRVGAVLWQPFEVIKYDDARTNPNVSIAGTTPEFQSSYNHFVADGRFISEQDVKFKARVAVLGNDIVRKLFPFDDPVDKTIKINGKKYQVIGVFEEKGTMGFSSLDNYICIPITSFLLDFGEKTISLWEEKRSLNIIVQVRINYSINEVKDEVRELLRNKRGLKFSDEDDFEIVYNEGLNDTFEEMTKTLRYVAFSIGLISLIAAGIGIMNVMLVTVTERTKEIGIRKAVGAKKKDIIVQFLIEALVICEIGGMIGILVGIALGNIVAVILGASSAIPFEWVMFGLLLSGSTGMIFGLWPAYKASSLNPIDSLRYE